MLFDFDSLRFPSVLILLLISFHSLEISFGSKSVSTNIAFVRSFTGVRSKQKHPVTRAHA